MKLYYITIILFIISIICLTIGAIMKSKKIKKAGYYIMIFTVAFWVLFLFGTIYEMDKEYERHFSKENYKSFEVYYN